MPASLPLGCLLCLRSLSFLAIFGAGCPCSDQIGASGTCLANPIRGSRSSTLTYGPNGKWVGLDCRVNAGFIALGLLVVPPLTIVFGSFLVRGAPAWTE